MAVLCAAAIGIRSQVMSARVAALRVERGMAVNAVSSGIAVVEGLRVERQSIRERAKDYEQRRGEEKSRLTVRGLADLQRVAVTNFGQIDEDMDAAEKRVESATARIAMLDTAIGSAEGERGRFGLFGYAMVALGIAGLCCAAAGFALEPAARRRRDAADATTADISVQSGGTSSL